MCTRIRLLSNSDTLTLESNTRCQQQRTVKINKTESESRSRTRGTAIQCKIGKIVIKIVKISAEMAWSASVDVLRDVPISIRRVEHNIVPNYRV